MAANEKLSKAVNVDIGAREVPVVTGRLSPLLEESCAGPSDRADDSETLLDGMVKLPADM